MLQQSCRLLQGFAARTYIVFYSIAHKTTSAIKNKTFILLHLFYFIAHETKAAMK